ncbi:MAG TPA: dTDP-4-dehydrorhamnose 3,5-epimerase [Candidatus Wallbacteria bacterium]|nr:dTDP-4-dehydrorhamnose 3,5-epimerase [Candidatus Wallbacteria bacterium]
MPFYKTEINDVMIFEPLVIPDERGYFYESYNENTFNESGITSRFVQDNQSRSTYGVLRGLHYQLPPHAQAKLVRVLSGKILDVAVDIRRNSPTFKKWVSVELSAENARQIFIPRGFAHGFLVLSDTAEVFYKCDNAYNAASNRGIAYNDSSLAIDWRIDHRKIILSSKDKENPDFENAENCF